MKSNATNCRFRTIVASFLSLSFCASLCAGPIHDAASEGDVAKVSSLLAADASLVNTKVENSATPLMHAIQSGKIEVVKLLLGKGADVNIKNRIGRTALFERGRQWAT